MRVSPSRSLDVTVADRSCVVVTGSGDKVMESTLGAVLLMVTELEPVLPSRSPSLGVTVHCTVSPAAKDADNVDDVSDMVVPSTLHA